MNAITPISEKRAVRVQVDWTPEMVGTLTELWKDGLSTAQIGKRIGLSASAIIGKAYREGLPRRRKTNAQLLADARGRTPQARNAQPKRNRVHDGYGGKTAAINAKLALGMDFGPNLAPVKSRVLSSNVWRALPGATPTSLADLPANGCKWPVGDAPTLFCACERHNGTPYCETHASRAYAGFGKGIDGKAGPRHA